MNPPNEERQRIFGLETEHTILYLSEGAEPDPAARPPFALLQQVLFDCLLAGRKSAPSSGVKGGHFLENGGLVHLELFLRSQSDTPVLETATPECRSPWDLMTYARAFDEILDETSRRSEAALREKGYRGRLAFGKSNLDAHGAGIGSHENYLVHCPPTWRDYLVWALAAPALIASFFPAFLIFAAAVVVVFASLLALSIASPVGRRLPRRALEGLRRTWRRIVERHAWVPGTARAVYYYGTHAILFPALALYSVLLGAFALRPFLRGLTAFLVTRQALTGNGFLNFEGGVFEISQRASLTRRLGAIVMFGRKKSIFDFKAFLFDPVALFRPTKKLTLSVGSSNLSDVPTILKLGTTALVIEMVEAGESFDDLRLHRPLRALRDVSREGPWKVLTLRSGKTLTALEIQREYLRRAKEFFSGRPQGRLRQGEIIRIWGETLEQLSDRPMSLSDSLDWVIKKSLLDQAVLARTNWKAFLAWGRLLDAAGLEAAGRARSLQELIRLAPLRRRRRIRRLARRGGVEPSEFSDMRDLYFQTRKLDLRFHELGGGTGYQRFLEAEGLVRRLTDSLDVSRAVREPPQDTRARVRGYYIQNSHGPLSVQVSWTSIEFRERGLASIPIPDPFQHRLPLE